MVVGSATGVVPSTTSKALGTLLWVLGGRGGYRESNTLEPP